MNAITITPDNPWSARLVALAISTMLATLFTLALPGAAHALGDEPDLEPVGRVLTARGEVFARQPDSEPRDLGRGDHVYEGDTLLTGDGGRAQVRFMDQGLVQLQPETEYIIEHYREEEGERGAFTRLVEGGMRALSGTIGEQDRENYRLDTPVASIGLRGTHYAVNHCAADCDAALLGSVGGVIDGRIGVSNGAGEEEFGRNEFFAVRDANTPPERLPTPPPGLLDPTDADEGEDEGEGGEDPGGDSASFSDDSGGDEEGEAFDSIDDELLARALDTDYRSVEGVESVDSSLAFANNPYFGRYMSFDYVGKTDDGDTFTYSSTIDADLTGTYPELHALSMEYSLGGEHYSWSASVNDGATPVEVGGVSEFGVGWGQWAEGDYTHTLNGDTYASSGDWYYVMVDSMDRLTDMNSTGLSGEHTFSWGGGVASHTVFAFELTADFSSMEWVSGTADFSDWRYSADLSGTELSQFFAFVLNDAGSDGTNLNVNGAFYGDSAEGAMITFQDTGDGINGAGVLERQ